MKSLNSLVLLVSFLACGGPAVAENLTVTRPIGAGVGRVAILLAAQPAERRSVDWSRVRALPPGARIKVTTGGAESTMRDFVSADDSELITLNPSPALPDGVVRRLREIAAVDPAFLGAVQGSTSITHPGQVIGEEDLRIEPDGVFLAGRKLVDLHQLTGRIPRSDVREIVRRAKSRTSGVAKGVAIGGGIGAAIFFLAAPRCITTDCWYGSWAALIGSPIIGGLTGSKAKSVDEVIYRAP